MPEPPRDTDPELFIIGRGGYDSLRVALPSHDEGVFRIDPAPMPVTSIIVMNVLVAAVFGGAFYFARNRPSDPIGAAWLTAIAGVGVTICTLFTSIVCYRFRSERRAGPWLIYHKATGRVDLPRHGVSFARDEIVHVQYITTKDLRTGEASDQLSELNLVTVVAGERKRWPMLRSIFNAWPFEYIVRPMVEQTGLPVVRVKDRFWGWKVTVTPWVDRRA
ncbi:MAG: hypothetical protein ABIP55_08260 [Tepidisphaeraceae bacterium]